MVVVVVVLGVFVKEERGMRGGDEGGGLVSEGKVGLVGGGGEVREGERKGKGEARGVQHSHSLLMSKLHVFVCAL